MILLLHLRLHIYLDTLWALLQAYVEDLNIFVDDTIREIEEVKKQKPDTPIILMGHSMGGLIACMVALKRPDLISGSCLSAPCLKVCYCSHQVLLLQFYVTV